MEKSSKKRGKVDYKLCSLKFLRNSASILQNHSNYNQNFATILHQLREKYISLSRPKGADSSTVFKKTEVCSFCGNFFYDGKYKLKILPHKHKMKLLRKKLLRKTEELKSKYSKHLSDFFSERKDNVLGIQCKVCKKVTKLGLNKPILKNKEAESIFTPNENLLDNKKKKKKSKKDRFSGLNPLAVINARLSQSVRESPLGINSLNESTLSAVNSDSKSLFELTDTPVIERKTNPKRRKSLDDDGNTSGDMDGGGIETDKLNKGDEVELDHQHFKKRKKQRSSLIMSNISSNDKSISNSKISSKKIENCSPNLNRIVNITMKQNSGDLKNSPMKQLNSQKNKINKKSKKKKKNSDLLDFLNQL